jgi:trehalose/maltose hydrolase-like predicted phosphorylase
VERHTLEETDFVTQLFGVQATVNDPVRVEKIVSLYTSRDPAITECGLQAKKAVHSADSFGDLLQSHVRTWEHLWHRFGIELQNEDAEHQDRVEMVVHLYIFHVLQSISVNTMNLDLNVGVPSRGWHGEAYRGHVLWDELFIFPMINLRLPEITRQLLVYRYKRLNPAREAARRAGYRGAVFPLSWRSGCSTTRASCSSCCRRMCALSSATSWT